MSEKISFFQDAFLTGLRTAIAMVPPALVALLVWYWRHGFTPRQHLDVVGFFAVLTLALLAIYTLRRHTYRTYGRLGMAAFAIWASSSSLWRALSFMGTINAEQRLLANTIIASLLALTGIYVMFTHRLVLEVWRNLTQASDDVLEAGDEGSRR